MGYATKHLISPSQVPSNQSAWSGDPALHPSSDPWDQASAMEGGRPSLKPWLILMCSFIKELWSRGSEVGGIRCNESRSGQSRRPPEEMPPALCRASFVR